MTEILRNLATTASIWLLTWQMVKIPMPTMIFGWVILQAIYVIGVYLAVSHLYLSVMTLMMGDDKDEKTSIGFSADDSDAS